MGFLRLCRCDEDLLYIDTWLIGLEDLLNIVYLARNRQDPFLRFEAAQFHLIPQYATRREISNGRLPHVCQRQAETSVEGGREGSLDRSRHEWRMLHGLLTAKLFRGILADLGSLERHPLLCRPEVRSTASSPCAHCCLPLRRH